MTQTKYIQGAGGGNKFGGDNNGGTEAMTLCSPYSLPTFLI